MDILALIKKDHAEVKALFKEFEEMSEGAKASRAKLAKKITEELHAHDQAEEATLYGMIRERAREHEERIKVLEGYEEHAMAADMIGKIDQTDPKDETYVAKMDVLREAVEHHIKEEEGQIHKIARKLLSKEELDELGPRFEAAKQKQMAGAVAR